MKKERIIGKDTLLYKGVLCVYIDRAHDAIYWAARHGMTITDTVTAENGERFDIYTGRGLGCAIPV